MAATGVGYVDPYSGTARYTGGAPPAVGGGGGESSSSNRRPDDVLPVSAPLAFRQANVEALSKKLFELDAALRAGPDAGLALTAEETRNVKDIAAFLSLPKGALPNPENSFAKEGWDVASLFAVVPRWPATQRFPRG
jgi:phospholipase A-2-activating protein